MKRLRKKPLLYLQIFRSFPFPVLCRGITGNITESADEVIRCIEGKLVCDLPYGEFR